jgi:hypothetical protein
MQFYHQRSIKHLPPNQLPAADFITDFQNTTKRMRISQKLMRLFKPHWTPMDPQTNPIQHMLP